MKLLTTGILFTMTFIAENIQAELSSVGENVCLQTETYETTIEVEVVKPVIKKKKEMCWSLRKFFRCEKTIKQFITVKKPQVSKRTRIVPTCCKGYAEEKGQPSKCSPVCPNGCKNGKCVAPGVCNCSSGFYGSECEKACPRNFWGNNCINKCDCSNNGNCDSISGECHCDSGWRGKSCELLCQVGFYGYYCKEKCNCDGHLCNHITGKCLVVTTENAVTVTLFSTTQEWTTETSVEIHQSSKSSTTDENTTTVKKGFLLEDTERTIEETISSEIITSNASGVTVTVGDGRAIVKLTEEPNKNEKEIKMISLKQIIFSSGTENITEVSEKKISVSETLSTFNSTENISIWTSFSEIEKNIDKNGTNSFIKKRKKSFSSKRTLTVFHLIPSLSVISSVSFLILIIAAKWITSKLRKKAGKKAIAMRTKEKLFQSEEQIKFQTENFFWVNNCTKNPLPDIELNTTPILETFKPVTPNKGFISKEKEIK